MIRIFLILDFLSVITATERGEPKLMILRHTKASGVKELEKQFQFGNRWKRDQTNYGTPKPELRPFQITSIQSLRELLNHMRHDHFKPVSGNGFNDEWYTFSGSNLGSGSSYGPLPNRNFDNLYETPTFSEDSNRIHQTDKVENRDGTRKNSARKKYAVKKHIFIGAGGCWVVVFILLCICRKKTPKTDFQIKIEATPTCGNAACINHRHLDSSTVCLLETNSFHPVIQPISTVVPQQSDDVAVLTQLATSANSADTEDRPAGHMPSNDNSTVSIYSSDDAHSDPADSDCDLPPSYDEALANFANSFPPSYSSVMHFSSAPRNAAKGE